MNSSPEPHAEPEREYEEFAEKRERIHGHQLDRALHVCRGAQEAKMAIDYASAAHGLAAAVRWVADRYGAAAADELTRHIVQDMNDSVESTEGLVLTLLRADRELKQQDK